MTVGDMRVPADKLLEKTETINGITAGLRNQIFFTVQIDHI